MPNHLQDVDYYSIFQRMLSGDMTDCFPLNATDTKVLEILKCTKCYNPNLRPTYFFTSNDIEYDNMYWATVGKVAWKSDCLWEGSTQIIPTSTSFDIIDATPQLIYNDTSKRWQFDPFGTSSLLYNGPITSNPIGIYTNGSSNILVASDEIYNFIIALTEDSQYGSFENGIVKLTESSTYELISSYYIFSNGAYIYNDINYLIVGQVQRTNDDTWSGVVSAIPEFAPSPILQPTINISHDEFFNWSITSDLQNFNPVVKTRYFGNPHPNGVYNNLNGQIIVDRDLSKYITSFYIMDDGSIWVFDENENFTVHGT
jgi:hypothetical protein